MTFSSSHEVRYSDVDRFGHVNHLRLLEFFESARNPFFAALAASDGQPDVLASNGFRIVRLVVDFRAPVGQHARTVDVHTSVLSLGRSSLGLGYDLRHDGQSCVQAQTTVVFVDQDEKPEPMSPRRREFLAQHLAAPDDGDDPRA